MRRSRTEPPSHVTLGQHRSSRHPRRADQTAYARFDELRAEHCNPNANRNRELDAALEMLDSTCECGNPKIRKADGTLNDACQECEEIDQEEAHNRRLE